MDDEALYDFCRANGDLRIERTAQGELIIMSPTGGETGRRNFAITGQLAAWVEHVGGGVGFDSSTGFILPNGAERSPDAAWVAQARWDALSSEERTKFVPLCPDFVIELRSSSDTIHDVEAKMSEYIECGARLGWLIDPEGKRICVYRPGGVVEVLDNPAVVSGEGVLPGFELDLARVW